MDIRKSAFVSLLVLFSVADECQSCFSKSQFINTKLKTGSSYYHECKCMEHSNQLDSIKWVDPHGLEIAALGPGTQHTNVYTEKNGRNVSLHIRSISKTIAGQYKCVASHNDHQFTSTILIEAYDPVYFVNTNENQYLTKGRDDYIICEARGEPNPLITWYKGQDDPVQLSNDAKYVIETNRLKINEVDDHDNGTYKCTASVLENGEEVDRIINVEVMTFPVIYEIRVLPNRTVVVGENVTIECLASGKPNVEYTWRKITGMDTSNYAVVPKYDMNTISFEYIEQDDQGAYQCVASNPAGNITKEVFIRVFYAPEIEEFENVTASEGSTAQIVCKASGRPPPQLTMTFLGDGLDKDGSIIPFARTINENESLFTLSFTTVHRSHEGIYVCSASNDVNSVNASIEMLVLYKPYFQESEETIWGWNGKTVNLNCSYDSNPPGEILWRYQGNDVLRVEDQLRVNKELMVKAKSDQDGIFFEVNNSSDFGIYECVAKNDIGEAKKTIILREGFVPPVISNVSTLEITSTSITFMIESPANISGPPVLGFTAEYDEAENYNITSIHRNRTWAVDRPFKISKLRPNTLYYFKFAAINDVGTGPFGDMIEAFMLDTSAPETPLLEADEDYNKLRWTVAENNGEPIDSYIVTYCQIDDDANLDPCEVLNTSSTTFDLNTLIPNTTFVFEVVAHNSKGNSSSAFRQITSGAAKEEVDIISAEAIIGLAVLLVIVCILIVDIILLCCKRKGMIASCCFRRPRRRRGKRISSRDKKGLLKSKEPPTNDNAQKKDHEEFEYNRKTGVITGKHSAV